MANSKQNVCSIRIKYRILELEQEISTVKRQIRNFNDYFGLIIPYEPVLGDDSMTEEEWYQAWLSNAQDAYLGLRTRLLQLKRELRSTKEFS